MGKKGVCHWGLFPNVLLWRTYGFNGTFDATQSDHRSTQSQYSLPTGSSRLSHFPLENFREGMLGTEPTAFGMQSICAHP